MPAGAKRPPKLYVNQQRVFHTLKAETRPLTAYEVIDRVSHQWSVGAANSLSCSETID